MTITEAKTNDLLERSMSNDPESWPILSFSQLQSWDRCEYAWALSYRGKWVPKELDTGESVGTLLHQWLHIYYSAIRHHSYESCVKLIEENIKEHTEQATHKELPNIARAAYSVFRYIHEFAPIEDKDHQILSSEYHFTVPFKTNKDRNFILQGYVDCISKWFGKMHVWDHKSSGSAQFWTPTEVMMDPQTPLYAICLRELGMPINGITINQMNTYPYKDMKSVPLEKLFHRSQCHRTDKELAAILVETKTMVDDLLEGNTKPRRSLRRDCKNCRYNEPCLMGLKGINMVPFLETNFQKKSEYEVHLNFNPPRLDL